MRSKDLDTDTIYAWSYPDYGYVTVSVNTWRSRGPDSAAEETKAREALSSLTLEQVLTGKLPHELLDAEILTRLAALEGPYDEVIAAEEAARRTQKEYQDRQESARQVREERLSAVRQALAKHGIRTYREDSTTLRLSVEEAEKLVNAYSTVLKRLQEVLEK